MPKKPKIDKRLDKLFRDFTPEESTSRPIQSSKTASELPPLQVRPVKSLEFPKVGPEPIQPVEPQPPPEPVVTEPSPSESDSNLFEAPLSESLNPPREPASDSSEFAPVRENFAPPLASSPPLGQLDETRVFSPSAEPYERKQEIPYPARQAKRHTAALIPPERAVSRNIHEIAAPSNYSINFQTGQNEWSTLRVLDDTSNREWSVDEQLLIKQVVDQLALALENARLFQQTIERNEQLAALNQEILRFQLGIEKSDDAVFITDPNGTIEYANTGFEKVYGFSPAEAIGKNPRILQSGLIPKEQYKKFWDTLLSGGTVTGEITNRRKDGRLISIAGTNSPILDEKGQILGFLAVHHDLTQTKMAEDAIRRQNEYLGVSSEIGRLVTSTLDLNTIFSRTVNLICERFEFYFAAIYIVEETGFKAMLREATGEAGAELIHRKYSVSVNPNTIVGKVTSEGQLIVVNDVSTEPLYTTNPLLPDTKAEAAIPLKIGSRIIGALDIQSMTVNSFEEDEISVLQTLADQVAIAIDNARSYELSQEAVKEMRETDRVKSQFLANMSHELRTPLNSIIGFSRVILKGIDGPVTELQQQDLTAIYNSGQHLLSLINDILDLAKIEAGKMELAFDEVNMTDVTNSVLSTMTGLIKDKPIRLKRIIEEDLPTVRADAIRVRQVMINLLANAAKFTEEGDITVEVRKRQGPAGRMEIQVAVTDTGPGISSEDQAKLFQAFSQVDDSPTRKTGGTGLGLSISHHLISMHGGRIWVESELGKGSTFTFSLPLFRREFAEGSDGEITRFVLAIDDDPQVIGLYERYLQPQGYQVIPLTDPSRGLDRARQLKPFAITLDIMMPGVNGWQVLERLKGDPETRDIPVIICSIIEEKDKGFSLGAADYLTKPILEEELVGALNRLNSDGSIREVLIVDNDPNDLRLLTKMLSDDARYKPIPVEGGKKGWDMISTGVPPHAVILDLFMPDMDGFMILENMRADPNLRDIPVIVISGMELTVEQRELLNQFGQRLLSKGSFTEQELLNSLQRALDRMRVD